MKLLLDTHIFLWFISGDNRLSGALQEDIRNLNNEVYLSVVSVWEAIIKYQLGKLPLPEPPESYLPRQRNQHLISSLLVDAAAISAGITKKLSSHRIRHSGITAALDATGGDVRRVQKLSRHAKLETLMIYDDNRTNHQGDLTELLSGMV